MKKETTHCITSDIRDFLQLNSKTTLKTKLPWKNDYSNSLTMERWLM